MEYADMLPHEPHRTRRMAHALGVDEGTVDYWVSDLLRRRRGRRRIRRPRR